MDDSIHPEMRQCTKCGKVKPITEYYKTGLGPNSYYSYCKVCKQYQQKHSIPREVLPEGMKRCTECLQIKPITEFTNRIKGGTVKLPKCKKCNNKIASEYARSRPEKMAQKRKLAYIKNPRQSSRSVKRKHKLAKQYGLTVEQLEDMYAAQFGLCAICELAPKDGLLVIDHCHVSGVVRGLLCRNCNTMIGMAKDNLQILRKAMKYLNKHLS